MKKLIAAVSLITITMTANNAVFASCLDVIPTSNKALSSELKKAQSELSIAKDMEANYRELAISAKGKRDLSMLVATTSTLPLAFISGGFVSSAVGRTVIATGIQASLGLGGTVVLGATSLLGPLIANGAISVKLLRNILKENNVNQEDVDQFVEEYSHIDVSRCSFREAQSEADRQKNEILDSDLNGSIKNTIIDHISLGSTSKKATEKLYALAKIKTLLSESKVEELKKYKFE